MKIEVLKKILCPYCESKIRIKQIFIKLPGEAIKYGVVSCNCDEYPIVLGILYLKKDAGSLLNHQAIVLLKNKRFDQAELLLLQERKKVKFAFRVMYWLKRVTFLAKVINFEGFLSVLKVVDAGSTPWLTYLQNRYSRPTFWLSLATLSLAKKDTFLIDIACGTGDFLVYAASTLRMRTCIGVDHSFSLLLLARTFKSTKNISFICADVEHGLPFYDDSAQLITVNDAFMYIHRKQLLINESWRVLSKSGRLLLTHVHHKEGNNLGQGYAITLPEMQSYRGTFTVYGATDTALFKTFSAKQQLEYEPIQRLRPAKIDDSYSFLLTKNAFPLPLVVLQKIATDFNKITIDYTEEQRLKSHS
ncbi:MAG: class I SAM-dependent methyltransferase [bacterium]|nr:class I SAM-dependent methyltransferase [bacterium]